MKRTPFKKLWAGWSQLPIRHRGAIVVAIPAVCLVITLTAWVWSREVLIAVRREIESTDEVIREGNTLLLEQINAETGVRGYTFTRDRTFLEPYRQSLANYQSSLKRLQQLQKKKPGRLAEGNTIQQLVQRNLDNLQQIVNTTEAQQLSNPVSPISQSLFYTGKKTMDALRASVGAMQQTEQTYKDTLLKRREGIQEATSAAIWFTAVISGLGFFAAIYLFRQLDRELRDRELRLRESRSLLEAIVANVVDGVILLDEASRIETFNPTACDMFGYQPDEVIGREVERLLVEAQSLTRNPQTNAKQSLMDSPPVQTGRAWQTSGIRKDGTTFPIAISVSDVQLDDRRLLAIIRDMTDVQATQEKLQSRADELARITTILAQTNVTLEDRNRELEQFAYVASHDLKAPLRAIANLSEWIEEDLQGQLPTENQRQMVLLRGRVHRMEALINGLLDYSRVGRTKAPLEKISVKVLLEEIIDSLAPPATVTIAIAPNLPIFTTKVMLLRQVFANLISNAIKHHDRLDGHITIAVQEQEKFYEFSVADDGPGIDANYHAKVFVIFQTLEARDTKESTGIGLAIVKRIVEAEGGSIWIDSQEGSGATFYFTWLKESPHHG
ncbi:MAG: diguanylate cyclase [Leptolyngbya sp.]|nr:MAG: diguanylate cyclase [Leptolyngbya sp.]